jgi:hypothetical protein
MSSPYESDSFKNTDFEMPLELDALTVLELEDAFEFDELLLPGFVSPLEMFVAAPKSGELLESDPQAKRQ